MTLLVALIRAGNLPADERRKNDACWFRIASAFREVEKALGEWVTP